MKKFLSILTALTLSSGSTLAITPSIMTKEQPLKSEQKINSIVQDGGIDLFEYKFLWSNLYFSHNSIEQIWASSTFLGGLRDVLLDNLKVPEGLAELVVATLSLQWPAWGMDSYDKGNGIGVQMLGSTLTIVDEVWSQ